MARIDAHVHVWTDDVEKYPLADGFARAEMQPPTFFPEDILAHARPCGVERVVLVQMSYYGFDNSYMLDVMSTHAGIFSGIAVIDMQAERPDDATLALAGRARDGRGGRGGRRPAERRRGAERRRRRLRLRGGSDGLEDRADRLSVHLGQ